MQRWKIYERWEGIPVGENRSHAYSFTFAASSFLFARARTHTQGITYSVMSASWDPDREGSALGVDEFQRNVDNIKEGLGRSRENAVLREKMTGLSSTEIKAALTDLEKREKAVENSKRQQSLQKKLEDELE